MGLLASRSFWNQLWWQQVLLATSAALSVRWEERSWPYPKSAAEPKASVAFGFSVPAAHHVRDGRFGCRAAELQGRFGLFSHPHLKNSFNQTRLRGGGGTGSLMQEQGNSLRADHWRLVVPMKSPRDHKHTLCFPGVTWSQDPKKARLAPSVWGCSQPCTEHGVASWGSEPLPIMELRWPVWQRELGSRYCIWPMFL